MILKQKLTIAAAALFTLGPPVLACSSMAASNCLTQNSPYQTETENKTLPPPQVFPGYSGSIRRGVCTRQAIKTAKPIYPDEAEKQGIKGVVIVQILINEKGGVDSARSLNGPEALRPAAEEAVKKWRFRVARIGGKPVKISCDLSFLFPPEASQVKRRKSKHGR